MIEVQDVVKKFAGVTAVDGVSFTVPRGQVVGFLGPNGAGKSTTMRILTGYFPPTEGSVRVDGVDVLREPLEARRRMGYLPESVPLYREMRVLEYLDYRARLKGVAGRAERKRRLDEAIARCGLEGVRRKMVGHLSKGYRQRVGIADVVVHAPPVLVLDEPTVRLPPAPIRDIRTLVRDLGSSHTVLLSTHILQEVDMVCDRVLILVQGRIALDRPMEAFGADGTAGLEETFLEILSTDPAEVGASSASAAERAP